MTQTDAIVYSQPAEVWTQALPLGNGHMGVMGYGGICEERFDLSELTFFSGNASSALDSGPHSQEAYPKLREKLLQQQYEETPDLVEQMLGRKGNYGTNLPVGSVFLRLHPSGIQAQEYQTVLSFSSAILQTDYRIGNIQWERTSFLSNADKIFVVRIRSESGGEAKIRLELATSAATFEPCAHGLAFFCSARETVHSDGTTGVNLWGRIAAFPDEGTVSVPDHNNFSVSFHRELLLLVSMETDFALQTPEIAATEQIASAAAKGYELLLKRHLSEYRALYDKAGLTLDSCLEDQRRVEQLFRYGRYLLLSSSRPDSELPCHLQGVWNDSIACSMCWTCDMHLDINTQMNYWPSELLGLSECSTPLFRWICGSLVPSGQITAQNTYGLPGWVAHIFSNAWGYSAPGWGDCWGLHVTGGAWIASHLWEHYAYTLDKNFLRETVLPVYEGLASFFTEYLAEDPETRLLLPGPSISPENYFLMNNRQYAVSMGTTTDVVVIRETLQRYLQTLEILGEQSPLQEKCKHCLKLLPGFQVGKRGQLQEWLYDFDELDPHHRHTSHLLAVYPFRQISCNSSEKLKKAVETSIEHRLFPEEQWEDTGWARALMLLYAARLRRSDWCEQHIKYTLREKVGRNLMILHPPTAGAKTSVYELDGNTGFTAGIAEMLLDSDGENLWVLPSIPPSWQKGSFRGFAARGGISVSCQWQPEGNASIHLQASREGNYAVHIRGKTRNVSLHAGESLLLVQNTAESEIIYG